MSDSTPLIKAAIFVSGATVILNLLVAFGIAVTPEQRSAILEAVAFFMPILAAAAVAWYGHRTTTPLANPKTESGLALTGPDGELTDAQTRAIQKGN